MLVLWIYSVILILFSFSRSSSLDSSDIFPYPSEISPESAAEVPPEFPSESLLSDVSLFSVASDDGDASDISWLDDGAVDDDDDGNIENLIVGDSGRRCQLGKKRSDESCSTSQETQLQSPSIDLFQDDTATFLQGEDIACPERKHLCCDGPPEAQSLPIVYRLIRQCVQGMRFSDISLFFSLLLEVVDTSWQ